MMGKLGTRIGALAAAVAILGVAQAAPSPKNFDNAKQKQIEAREKTLKRLAGLKEQAAAAEAVRNIENVRCRIDVKDPGFMPPAQNFFCVTPVSP